jgi:hypothetical protein
LILTVTTKSTALLLAAAAGLFAFVYFVEWPMRQTALTPPNRRILPDLDPAKIIAVEIQAGGRVVRIEQTNHAWQLTAPIEYPANAALVGRFLQGLAQWEWETFLGPDELTNRPNAMEEFGFDPPQFTLLLREEGRERVLNIGHVSAVGDQVYLNFSGSTVIYIAADLLRGMTTNPDQWRDLKVLDLAATPFQRLEVHPTNPPSFDLKLDPATRLWSMTSPLQRRADTPKIVELLSRLQELTVSNFVPDGSAELALSGLQDPTQPPLLELKFLRDAGGTNIALDLQMGSSPTNNPALAYARRQSPANVIEIARDPLLPWESNYTNFLDRHLTSLSPALMDSISVAGWDKFTVKKTTNGSWVVSGAETFPADPALMEGWLAALTNIEVDILQTVVADLAGYGLDKPATPLLQYDLNYAAAPGRTNRTVIELLFGAGTNQTGVVFERRPDEQSVNTISIAQFERLPAAHWQLRDRAVWNFETNEVVGIVVRQRGAEREFRRDAAQQWRLARGRVGLIVPAAIEETLYRLGRLRAVYWSGIGEDHLERFGFDETDYRISLEIQRGGRMETNTIQFGRPSPHLHPYASVERNGRRLVFEFPVDLYDNLVTQYLGVPPDPLLPY